MDLSIQVKRLIKSVPKQCYKNAFMAINRIDLLAGALYVEGWGVTEGIHSLAIEHGWIELNNKIIDPTIPGEILEYYPVKKYTRDEMRAAYQKNNELPFMWAAKNNYSDCKKARDLALKSSNNIKQSNREKLKGKP